MLSFNQYQIRCELLWHWMTGGVIEFNADGEWEQEAPYNDDEKLPLGIFYSELKWRKGR